MVTCGEVIKKNLSETAVRYGDIDRPWVLH